MIRPQHFLVFGALCVLVVSLTPAEGAWPRLTPIMFPPPPPPPVIIIEPVNFCALQTETQESSYPFSFGDSEAGVTGEFSAASFQRPECNDGQTTQPAEVRFEVEADVDLRLFGGTYDALDASAHAVNTDGEGTAEIELQLGGYTLYSATDSELVIWSENDSIQLLQATTVVMVGPVPVTIEVSCGVGYEASVTLEVSLPVTVTASVGTWVEGTASLGVGVPCVNVSLQCELHLLDTELAASVELFPDTGSGSLDLILQPVVIILQVCAELCPFGETCETLAEYSLGAFTENLLSF